MNDNDEAHEHTVNLRAENRRLREALEVIVGKIRIEDEMIDIAETALASTEATPSVCRWKRIDLRPGIILWRGACGIDTKPMAANHAPAAGDECPKCGNPLVVGPTEEENDE